MSRLAFALAFAAGCSSTQVADDASMTTAADAAPGLAERGEK